MSELEKLLIAQLSKLSAAHELHYKQLSEQQEQQARLLTELSQRVETLTQLLQN